MRQARGRAARSQKSKHISMGAKPSGRTSPQTISAASSPGKRYTPPLPSASVRQQAAPQSAPQSVFSGVSFSSSAFARRSVSAFIRMIPPSEISAPRR